jgi:hypothetical protein
MLLSVAGWGVYTSTIGLWGPRRLISDGFDNVIRVFTLESGFFQFHPFILWIKELFV